ncbi:hypothetical protein TGAM01_v204217 [Trichoderma gamsii]|uniref:Uncharacterized protein n=1 Tax=Trichoderma gamsii TaxID=398673 RepID=A0A2P4ZR09_9HYPO|nr:hypothetical protein TGAM01_v204217 [Trichoderma gamsii]PON26716.1 hypothetical protein TGAM01_v204217 [Trichoderma gamsii]
MAAAVIGVLILVQETADTVTSIVKAIDAVANLLGRFSKQTDRTPQLMQCIELAKTQIIEEIHKAELEIRLDTLYTSADDWFKTLQKIVDLGEQEKKGTIQPQDLKDTLRAIWIDMMSTSKRLTDVKYYFEGSRPKPATPEMLSIYILCYSLLHSFTLAGDAVYVKMNDNITPNFVTGIEELERSVDGTDNFVAGYKTFRGSQLVVKELIEHEGAPLHTGDFKVYFDGGGDSAIENLTGTVYTLRGWNNITAKIIERRWAESKFGVDVPLILEKWNELHGEATGSARRLYKRHKPN